MQYFIRFSLAFVLSGYALGMYPSRLSAQEKSALQSKPFHEQLAALLDDETLCVVHVDFTRIDTDAVLDNTRTFINEESLKQLGQFLLPRPEGKRFVVKGSGDTLQYRMSRKRQER